MAERKSLEDLLKKEVKLERGKLVARVMKFEVPAVINGALIGVNFGDIVLVSQKQADERTEIDAIHEPHLDCSLREIRALAANGVPELKL